MEPGSICIPPTPAPIPPLSGQLDHPAEAAPTCRNASGVVLDAQRAAATSDRAEKTVSARPSAHFTPSEFWRLECWPPFCPAPGVGSH